jgi:putative transcriptional regulator
MGRLSAAEAKKRAGENADWDRIDAITDEDIARQIASDPDVAPDMSEALERGEFQMVWAIGLERVRGKTGLNQAAFARRFGLPAQDLVAWKLRGVSPTAPSGCI